MIVEIGALPTFYWCFCYCFCSCCCCFIYLVVFIVVGGHSVALPDFITPWVWRHRFPLDKCFLLDFMALFVFISLFYICIDTDWIVFDVFLSCGIWLQFRHWIKVPCKRHAYLVYLSQATDMSKWAFQLQFHIYTFTRLCSSQNSYKAPPPIVHLNFTP